VPARRREIATLGYRRGIAMDAPPPRQFHLTGELLPPPPPPPPPPPAFAAFGRVHAERRSRPRVGIAVALGLVTAIVGVLLGGRASAEDGRSAATTALATGDPARAVSLDEAVAARSGFLMVFDPGAASNAEHDAQVARLAWARQLAAAGKVDAAVAVLAQVAQPALLTQAAQTRARILIDAAAADVKARHAQLALQRLSEAGQGTLPTATIQEIAQLRAADEVAAAAELVAANRAPDALALLDDAAAHGAAAAAASEYPATLLAAARSEVSTFDLEHAAATLQRLVKSYASSAQANTARSMLATAQPVSGSLVDTAGHGASGRVRLSTHFTQLPGGGYVTAAPFYTGTANSNGDFTIRSVPVGGPYVLEYFRGGNWMTLVDPRTDEPANPVTVRSLVPEDLTFIVLPA
jgi:hypothetical protein